MTSRGRGGKIPPGRAARARRRTAEEPQLHRLLRTGRLGLLGAGSLLVVGLVAGDLAPRASSAMPIGDSSARPGRVADSQVPRPDRVVLVMFENKSYDDVIGSPDAPYLSSLAAGGANFTASYAVTHPSQPNYIALFSGSQHNVTNDSCPHHFKSNNEANQLLTAGYTFQSYAEDLPSRGSKVCLSGLYARKHAPWTNFRDVPRVVQRPFSAFPTDYAKLPDVSWVIPNLCHDMHNCHVATGDTWLQDNLGDYATWATTHNSLLIVTFDEDDHSMNNQIPTIFYGGDVVPGEYGEHITHYSVLRTIESMYGLGHLGLARQAETITDIWAQ